jgi:hypothetical protein
MIFGDPFLDKVDLLRLDYNLIEYPACNLVVLIKLRSFILTMSKLSHRFSIDCRKIESEITKKIDNINQCTITESMKSALTGNALSIVIDFLDKDRLFDIKFQTWVQHKIISKLLFYLHECYRTPLMWYILLKGELDRYPKFFDYVRMIKKLTKSASSSYSTITHNTIKINKTFEEMDMVLRSLKFYILNNANISDICKSTNNELIRNCYKLLVPTTYDNITQDMEYIYTDLKHSLRSQMFADGLEVKLVYGKAPKMFNFEDQEYTSYISPSKYFTKLTWICAMVYKFTYYGVYHTEETYIIDIQSAGSKYLDIFEDLYLNNWDDNSEQYMQLLN